jgi:hypothetical protein
MLVNAVLVVLTLSLVALSLGIGLWVWITFSYAMPKNVWYTTPGIVKDSRVVSNRPVNGLPGHHYFVGYEFTVFGEEYRARQVRFGDLRYLTRKAAERVVARYPAGSAVVVHYHKSFDRIRAEDEESQPIAVLEPGFNAECLYPLSVFLVIIALTATCLSILIARII